MPAIVQVTDLSKKYNICHQHAVHGSLKENLTHYAKRYLKRVFQPFKKNQEELSETTEEFWALQNLSFDIEEGERLAILGRNGAGKSTLLKLLSRITDPTTGTIKIKGRIVSLLEVGTGFHPDLTGRENILLNGAIMGMSHDEIRQKFDEIVAFADIEQFLDTPIKRYSSGMYMRLGFAIAAHLNAEILIIDEVLAVGDMRFQEKCINKINEIGNQGNTIIFVSHSINAVLSLCTKGLFLEKGKMISYEPIKECVSRYIRSSPTAGLNWIGEAGDEHIRFFHATLKAPKGNASFYTHGEKTTLEIGAEVIQPHGDMVVGFSILNTNNQVIARSRLCDKVEYQDLTLKKGQHTLACELDLNLFHPGEYQVKVDCVILNKKVILADEIFLKFAVYADNAHASRERGGSREGISLGNCWQLPVG